MARKVLLNAVGAFKAGDVFDPAQGQASLIAAAESIGGKFIDEGPAQLAAAEAARLAYARGDAGAATGIMLAKAGGGGGGGGGDIGWSPSGQGTATTFAEVIAQVAATTAIPIVDLLDGTPPSAPVTYQVSGTVDMRNGSFASPWPPQDQRILSFDDGAIVKNLGATVFAEYSFNGGMKVQFRSTGADAPLQWDAPQSFGPWFFAVAGAWLENLGTTPVIKVPTPLPLQESALVFVMNGNSSLGAGAGLAPIVELGANAYCIFSALNQVSMSIDPKWITGNVTNTIVVISNGFDFSQVTVWDFVTAGGNLFNVPLGLDAGSGPTVYRPIPLFGPVKKGTSYYDTDLVPPRPIWWDGVQWTDALGVGPV